MAAIVRQDSDDALQSYPQSRASIGSMGIVRSQTWCEDITQSWNVPITELESLEERVQRYQVYFTFTQQQMRVLLSKFLAEMRCGMELHKKDPIGVWENSKCSLKMVDTCVTERHIPTGTERGSVFALDLAGSDVAVIRGVKVNLEGSNRISTTDVVVGLRDATPEFPKGLLDRKATASALFDCLAGTVKQLKEEKGSPVREEDDIPLGFAVCFPLIQRALNSASLIHWTKGFETGRGSDDPVEGMDVAALLDCAFWRAKLRAKTRAVLNDTTGALLTCAYENPPRMPPCKVGFVLGGGVNGCYMTSDTNRTYGYHGCVINCELGGFDKSLPLNDVDLEVDFADETTRGKQLFEKMVSETYLGELCRRMVVKIWQNEAPPLAWVRQSMPWLVCVRVMGDTKDLEMKDTAEILSGLWEWETTVEQRFLVQKLFQLVFDRSAALAAVAIVALASETGRLQPAMGGLTCAIGGALCRKSVYYFAKLRSSINEVLDEDLAPLIHLHQVRDCSAKGAGLLAWKSIAAEACN